MLGMIRPIQLSLQSIPAWPASDQCSVAFVLVDLGILPIGEKGAVDVDAATPVLLPVSRLEVFDLENQTALYLLA